MPTQTTYLSEHAAGFPGEVATAVPHTIITGICEDAAGIGFGRPVIFGSAERGVTAPNANGENNFVGITVRDESTRHTAAGAANLYPEGSNVMVMTQGEIYVTVSANVTAGGDVFIAEATGTFVAEDGDNITPLAGAKYITTTAANGVAKIRLN